MLPAQAPRVVLICSIADLRRRAARVYMVLLLQSHILHALFAFHVVVGSEALQAVQLAHSVVFKSVAVHALLFEYDDEQQYYRYAYAAYQEPIGTLILPVSQLYGLRIDRGSAGPRIDRTP